MSFRLLLQEQKKPLLLPGAINGYCARMAQRQGFHALYLSGGGVAAAMGLPDLAVIDLHDIATDASRITQASSLPLLVDADTGFGSPLNIKRTVKTLTAAGAAGLHLEDQVFPKRCGHRPNKTLASCEVMKKRLYTAVEARTDESFIIMARTDSLASETREQAVARAVAYVAAGADMLFLEAAHSLDDYRAVKDALPQTPLLANITEFGRTPLFRADELATAGVDIMLFPLSAFRAMNQAALSVYQCIFKNCSQHAVLKDMQTREALYDFLDYHAQEEQMNTEEPQ